ncbi:MAG: ankyrin repeat domain-containing protein [Alphaproteobacteria bacterium]|nr:ankyrin repeat domain-containing protein [Alphaproteobacteria bacterium]
MNIVIESLVEEITDSENHKIEPQIEKIKQMLSKGCDVNGQDKNGNTLLHLVAVTGSIRMYNTVQEGEYNMPQKNFDAEYLIKNFAPNPLIKNHDGLTPAMLAAQHKQTALWQLLSSYEQSFVATQIGAIMKELIPHQNLNQASRKRLFNAVAKLSCNRQRME